MMRLYYTHNYKNEFGESHRLLAKAVAGYISDTTVTESLTYICLDDLHTDSSVAAQAAELVSSMCPCVQPEITANHAYRILRLFPYRTVIIHGRCLS